MQDRPHPPTPPEAETAYAAADEAAERRELFADFVSAGELERRRVAESIHDDSIQVIAAMGMRLQMLRRAIDDPEQLGMLTEAEQAVQLSIARLRHLVYELHPPGLEQEGLAVALALALDSSSRAAAADYRLDDQLASQPSMPQSAILFRIAQEALANVREHAGASNVTVTLLERDGGHAVRIADDGRGFETAREAPETEGYGFASMRARVRLGGGNLHVESAPGAGTTVEAWLPRWQAGDSNGGPA
jgi:signal transduction histidine kinase